MQQLRKITVPMIRPTIIFTVIVSTIGGMQLLAEPLLFGGAGADRRLRPAVPDARRSTCTRSASAGSTSATPPTAAWVMFVIIVIVAAVNYLLTRRIRRA